METGWCGKKSNTTMATSTGAFVDPNDLNEKEVLFLPCHICGLPQNTQIRKGSTLR